MIHDILKIADIHAARIQQALDQVGHLFPMDARTVETIGIQELAWVDLMINRFAKLQDIIGAKLIDAFLEQRQEEVIGLSMLDKIHKLERLSVLDATLWKKMRDACNHAAHEYPDAPALTAEYLNRLFALVPALLELLQKLR